MDGDGYYKKKVTLSKYTLHTNIVKKIILMLMNDYNPHPHPHPKIEYVKYNIIQRYDNLVCLINEANKFFS